MAALSPTAITIHDDGYVARETPGIKLGEKKFLVAGRRFGEFRGFHLSEPKAVPAGKDRNVLYTAKLA
jgi:hypothetical protein